MVNVLDIINLDLSLLDVLSEFDICIFAYENEKNKNSLHEVMEVAKKKNYKKIAMIIGPEGGFTQDEASDIKSNDKCECVSLGSRILRAETAAINLMSVVMYELDNGEVENK